jgi:hypothetical protein
VRLGCKTFVHPLFKELEALLGPGFIAGHTANSVQIEMQVFRSVREINPVSKLARA